MVITLFQQDIAWQQPQANRDAVWQAMHCAQADVLVVPETFTTGFGGDMRQCAEQPGGDTLQWAWQLAREVNAMFVGTWVVEEGGQYFNRLHYVFPNGDYGYYDKAHLFRPSVEAQQLCRGTRRITVEWRGWRIRPAVCYDLRFPTWLRNTDLDYDLLLFCSNWPQARIGAWTTLLRARAIENQCYVVGCNRVGVDDAGTVYGGQSEATDFKGAPLAVAQGAQTITVTLDKQRLDTFRTRWPFYLDFD